MIAVQVRRERTEEGGGLLALLQFHFVFFRVAFLFIYYVCTRMLDKIERDWAAQRSVPPRRSSRGAPPVSPACMIVMMPHASSILRGHARPPDACSLFIRPAAGYYHRGRGGLRRRSRPPLQPALVKKRPRPRRRLRPARVRRPRLVLSRAADDPAPACGGMPRPAAHRLPAARPPLSTSGVATICGQPAATSGLPPITAPR